MAIDTSLNSLLKPNPSSNVNLRNYQHASRIFTDGNFRLTPKYGFLFYVEFDFNPLITSISNTAARELGMIVKTVTMPRYSIDHKVHNAYNRVNISQHKIKYDPVTITFHDDQADNVRNFWYDYYSFFFRDSDYADSTYQGISKYQSRPSFDWGYSPRPTVGYNNSNGWQPYQYIQGIRIYSLYQKNFSEYQLVNPVITSFNHGEHNQSDGQGLVQHQMQIQFETVKYLTGYTTQNTVGGYIDLHYDNTPSPIAPIGGTDLVSDGMGGAAHATDAVTDLAYSNPLTALSFIEQGKIVLNNTGSSAGGAFGTAFNNATSAAAAAGGGGGFNIPSFGSLNQGLISSQQLQQQLTAAAANLAGSATATVANGVIGGLSKGLGPQGTAVVGGIAAVISNPKGALAAVENVALTWATQKAANYIAGQVSDLTAKWITPTFTSIGETVAKAAGDVGNWLSSAGTSVVQNAQISVDYLRYAPEGMSYATFANGYFE